MKKLIFLCNVFFTALLSENKHFLIDICSFNNARWYEENLKSVLMQQYPYFRVVYTDDASIDGTGDLVERYLEEHDRDKKVTLIKNHYRRRALANHYNVFHMSNDDEIILTLDGDDWFRDSEVLTYLNELYQDPDVWFAYSTFSNWPQQKRDFVYARAYPEKIIETNNFRSYTWVCGQIRSFYGWLAKCIKYQDLILLYPLDSFGLSNRRYQGQVEILLPLEIKRAHINTSSFQGCFFPSACDVALMTPMMEMAGKHIRFIDDPLYIRNLATDINDHKVDVSTQKYCARYVRTLKEYKPLEKPIKNQHFREDTKIGILVFGDCQTQKHQEENRYVLTGDLHRHKDQLNSFFKSYDFIVAIRQEDIDKVYDYDLKECAWRMSQTYAHSFFWKAPSDAVVSERLFNTNFFCWSYALEKPQPGPVMHRSDFLYDFLLENDQVDLDGLWSLLSVAYKDPRSVGLFCKGQREKAFDVEMIKDKSA